MAPHLKKSGNSADGHPPTWIGPQLTRLVDEAPDGSRWVHEIKYDGYRMHARIDGGDIRLLTRTGLDWSTAIKRPSPRSVSSTCRAHISTASLPQFTPMG